MTRASLFALLIPALACSAGSRLPRSARGPAILEVRGAVKGGPFHLGEADLAELRQGKARGRDPITGHEASYQGADLADLEERVELTGGADTLVVHTADRRAIPIPLSILRLAHPVLAIRADEAPLPEPLLAWPDVEHHGLTADPRLSLWWARRVVALELVSWAKTFGRALQLPEGAPAGALAGAGAFGSRCIGCHRLRETGGEAGPDLTRAGGDLTADRLGTILDGHPGWAVRAAEPPGPGGVRQLQAFLGTVARVPPPELLEGDPDLEGPRDPLPPPALP